MQALAIVRSLRGVSQRKLAHRIRMKPTMLHTIEAGYRAPDPDFLPRVAEALGMTPAELDRALDVAGLARRTCEPSDPDGRDRAPQATPQARAAS